ncbi:RNA polymerase sigma factor SigZ [Thalassotalea sp. M1531]|uniref:RNA polymerase sigma factor SigZ n=1 Tax=Thalassotalea algicola TaxID=2716224 RepID=A0A7Y0Q8D1_9GAMM|nr:RNA polymerase sigma factor SigZ [Thalassotalea algicola]NMP32015.1 RNA polymerase sigma factor SigZ [Thalassotalea algicola]
MNIEHIWQEYKYQLERFLQRKVSNPSDVEELLQEILLKTHQQLGTVNQANSLKSWLFAIANNTIIDFYRKQKHLEPFDEEMTVFNESATDLKKALAPCLSPFINALDEQSSQLLRDIELGDSSQKDYAENHNIAYSTLKSRLQRSRGELKKLFEQCCTFELDKHGNIVEFIEKSNNCNKC